MIEQNYSLTETDYNYNIPANLSLLFPPGLLDDAFQINSPPFFPGGGGGPNGYGHTSHAPVEFSYLIIRKIPTIVREFFEEARNKPPALLSSFFDWVSKPIQTGEKKGSYGLPTSVQNFVVYGCIFSAPQEQQEITVSSLLSQLKRGDLALDVFLESLLKCLQKLRRSLSDDEVKALFCNLVDPSTIEKIFESEQLLKELSRVATLCDQADLKPNIDEQTQTLRTIGADLLQRTFLLNLFQVLVNNELYNEKNIKVPSDQIERFLKFFLQKVTQEKYNKDHFLLLASEHGLLSVLSEFIENDVLTIPDQATNSLLEIGVLQLINKKNSETLDFVFNYVLRNPPSTPLVGGIPIVFKIPKDLFPRPVSYLQKMDMKSYNPMLKIFEYFASKGVPFVDSNGKAFTYENGNTLLHKVVEAENWAVLNFLFDVMGSQPFSQTNASGLTPAALLEHLTGELNYQGEELAFIKKVIAFLKSPETNKLLVTDIFTQPNGDSDS